MALAMEGLDGHSTAKRGWFGLNPVVVGVLVVAVFGGLVLWKAQADPYRDGIARTCAASIAYKDKNNRDERFMDPTRDNLILMSLTISKLHTAELAKLKPTGKNVAVHRELLAGERRLQTVAAPEVERFAPYFAVNDFAGAGRAGFVPSFKAVYALARQQDALYAREFGIKHCSD
jgi:hypothetical protein